ncbi:hypothetical protein [Flagellimonas sp.]|uniref:hypothetical protein n=1 Tax=Flagellimonas sp. TaxID=2058762 RepID=UPI003B5C7636
MEKDKKTNMEDWIADGIKEVGLESPSNDFTRQVLSKLPEREVQVPQIIHSPLITKNGWTFVILSIIAIFTLFFYGYKGRIGEDQTILDKVFDFLSYDIFSGIHFSDTIVMGVVLFAVFACIQMVTLKRFIERQI